AVQGDAGQGVAAVGGVGDRPERHHVAGGQVDGVRLVVAVGDEDRFADGGDRVVAVEQVVADVEDGGGGAGLQRLGRGALAGRPGRTPAPPRGDTPRDDGREHE